MGQADIRGKHPPDPTAQNSERAVLTRTSTACEFEPSENEIVDQLPSIPLLDEKVRS